VRGKGTAGPQHEGTARRVHQCVRRPCSLCSISSQRQRLSMSRAPAGKMHAHPNQLPAARMRIARHGAAAEQGPATSRSAKRVLPVTPKIRITMELGMPSAKRVRTENVDARVPGCRSLPVPAGWHYLKPSARTAAYLGVRHWRVLRLRKACAPDEHRDSRSTIFFKKGKLFFKVTGRSRFEARTVTWPRAGCHGNLNYLT